LCLDVRFVNAFQKIMEYFTTHSKISP